MATVSLVFWPFMVFAIFMTKNIPNAQPFPSFMKYFFIFIPIFYGLFGYISTVVMCWIYNIYSKYLGGLIIEVEDI